jgi:uncharacterized protein YfaT (DUF1175 family)
LIFVITTAFGVNDVARTEAIVRSMAEKSEQKTKLKLVDKEQSERFKQTARSLDVEESKDFEQIFVKIVQSKKPQR